jgi:hypothetical protein
MTVCQVAGCFTDLKTCLERFESLTRPFAALTEYMQAFLTHAFAPASRRPSSSNLADVWRNDQRFSYDQIRMRTAFAPGAVRDLAIGSLLPQTVSGRAKKKRPKPSSQRWSGSLAKGATRLLALERNRGYPPR